MSVISTAGSWGEVEAPCAAVGSLLLVGLRLVRVGGRRIRGAAELDHPTHAPQTYRFVRL